MLKIIFSLKMQVGTIVIIQLNIDKLLKNRNRCKVLTIRGQKIIDIKIAKLLSTNFQCC